MTHQLAHLIFLEEVQELMEDFGLDQDTASNIAHDHLRDAGDTDTPSYKHLMGQPIPGCEHCDK